ncbi:MAG: zinc ribbon domain-containing protein [Vulcanimicrobiaceae bacterium]
MGRSDRLPVSIWAAADREHQARHRTAQQTCGHRLQVAAESRRKRRFVCVACGWSCHADVAGALEIRRRAELRPTSELPRARTALTLHEAA